MQINESYLVSNLSQFMEAAACFSRGDILWYRGQEDENHKLLPTLYRGKYADFLEIGGKKEQIDEFDSIHLLESMRMQHYHGKNYMFIKDNGVNTTEWLGSAQHFGIKTRFLDWSTSAIHSLVFSLEKYFEPPADEINTLPCVWMLRPQEMNRRIIKGIEKDLLKIITSGRCLEKEIKETWEKIFITRDKTGGKSLKEHKHIFVASDFRNRSQHMDYLYNLAYFERYLELARQNPKDVFIREKINPLYYLLARAYIKGDTFGVGILQTTPLAVIHPQNSDRIRMQNGVFTVFPFPSKTKCGEKRDRNMNYMRMEFNGEIAGTLGKIVLCEPAKIAEELRTIGVHRSWLYFEQEQISCEIESGL